MPLIKNSELKYEREIAHTKVNRPIGLVAKRYTKCGYSGNGGRRRIVYRSVKVFCQCIIGSFGIVHEYNMKTISAPCPEFYTIEFHRIFCVDIEIGIFDTIVQIEAVGGLYFSADTCYICPIKSEKSGGGVH